MLNALKTLSPTSLTLIGALSLPVAAQENLTWQERLAQLKIQFAAECHTQQESGAVNWDAINTLASINDRIEFLLQAEGITVVENRNQERFYDTQIHSTENGDADLVVNGHIAKRFPTCSRSSREFMSN